MVYPMGVGFHEYPTGWGVVVICPPTGETQHCLQISGSCTHSLIVLWLGHLLLVWHCKAMTHLTLAHVWKHFQAWLGVLWCHDLQFKSIHANKSKDLWYWMYLEIIWKCFDGTGTWHLWKVVTVLKHYGGGTCILIVSWHLASVSLEWPLTAISDYLSWVFGI